VLPDLRTPRRKLTRSSGTSAVKKDEPNVMMLQRFLGADILASVAEFLDREECTVATLKDMTADDVERLTLKVGQKQALKKRLAAVKAETTGAA